MKKGRKIPLKSIKQPGMKLGGDMRRLRGGRGSKRSGRGGKSKNK